MLLIIITMLLTMGLMGLLGSYTLVGEVMQLVFVGTLVALGIYRIRAVSDRMRRYQVG